MINEVKSIYGLQNKIISNDINLMYEIEFRKVCEFLDIDYERFKIIAEIIASETGVSYSAAVNEAIKSEAPMLSKLISNLSDEEFITLSSNIIPEPSIDQLKRQIKHCKNPMELKQLNRQLNEAYKDKKRKKMEM